jgi:hypothetical protein
MYDHWKLVHAYRKLAEEGKTEFMKHECGTILVSMIGENDEPVFWCVSCDVKIVPGVWVYDQMEAAIKENSD